MGSGFSSIFNRRVSPSPEPSLGDLPEGCVAAVMVHLDPPEICRLAILNRASRCASSADLVWKSKLPDNFEAVIERAFDEFPVGLCKRDIYVKLCQQNLFDDGTKKVWLDKNTGKLCMSISSKGLAITGIDDRRYWNWISTEESRFGAVAYVQQTWWFEVHGEVNFPFPPGKYSVFFRLQLGRTAKRFGWRICDSEHVHGWTIKPVKFRLSTNDGLGATTQCFLSEQGKWSHYYVGDFVVGDSNMDQRIEFSMTQIDCTHTKGGLCIDSVVIYPSELKERL